MSARQAPPLALSLAAAAEALGVSERTVYRMVRSGRLPSFTYPGITGQRVRWSDLEAYVDACADGAQAEDGALRAVIRGRLRAVSGGQTRG